MPRIEPQQLLKCLSVLLSPEGGILSTDEVQRLVNLMTKFSKKLVSKCVYILILKNSEQSLVDMFMGEGGWNLIHTWLQDAIHISNWVLVKEILSLLLITPVDVERLKLNNIPKLIKSLSRLEEVKGVQDLSNQLVHDWLVIVKGNAKVEDVPKVQPVESVKTENAEVTEPALVNKTDDTVDNALIKNYDDASVDTISTNTFYKVTVRDGKQVISKTVSVESSNEEHATTDAVDAPEPVEASDAKKEPKEKKSDDKSKTHDKNKSKSRSSSSKHSSSSSRSKSSSSSGSSSSKDRHKSSSSSSSKNSSKDRDRDRDRDKDKKDRHKANGAKSSSSSKDKPESKDKQAEKDKDTLAKIKPQSIDKLGRIPKKTEDKTKENKEIKKPTMSIEVRKNTEERPKTVKVFNSKRRSTGLEEEAKPPPPRPTKKPTVTLPTIPQKRPSPVKDLPAPPEKKFKLELPERPGAIKLIPPKPKRIFGEVWGVWLATLRRRVFLLC